MRVPDLIFLIFAGLGSASSSALTTRCHRRSVSPFAVAVSFIYIVALVYVIALPTFFAQFASLPDYARGGLSIALIAPLAFFMGMPFPLDLGRVAENASDFVPWAWGLNGFASVVSTALATIIAIEFGFAVVIVIALVLYGLAAMTSRSLHRH